jgi:hypothetical protein
VQKVSIQLQFRDQFLSDRNSADCVNDFLRRYSGSMAPRFKYSSIRQKAVGKKAPFTMKLLAPSPLFAVRRDYGESSF